LAVYSLNDCPTYESLSFAWGSVGRAGSNVVLIDNCYINITENLYDALVDLRGENEARIMWVDAICINQDDVEERSSQVQLMKHIYSNAKTVVWLGRQSGWSSRAFDLFQSMKAQIVQCGGRGAYAAEFQHQLSTDQDLQEVVKLGVYGDILQRPFWNRIWIFQEVSLPKMTTVVYGQTRWIWWNFLTQ
jgi:hypothetical protein